jgi:hypothetical protein
MFNRIAAIACAMVFTFAGTVASAQQASVDRQIADLQKSAAELQQELGSGLGAYKPSPVSAASAMAQCGTNKEQLVAEGYTEKYVFRGDELLTSVEYCSHGRTLIDSRRRLVAAGTVGYLYPGDRTKVAFSDDCENRGVLEGPPSQIVVPPSPEPVQAFVPPAPRRTPVVDLPPPEEAKVYEPPPYKAGVVGYYQPEITGEWGYCDVDHGFLLTATWGQVRCHPIRTAVGICIVTAAVSYGTSTIVPPCGWWGPGLVKNIVILHQPFNF